MFKAKQKEPTQGIEQESLEITQSKGRAFDTLVQYLNEAGFDTSSTTHTDIVGLIKSLSLDGIEATASKLAAQIFAHYVGVTEQHRTYSDEVLPYLETLKGMTGNFKDLVATVKVLEEDRLTRDAASILDSSSSSKTILNFLETCDAVGRIKPWNLGTSKISVKSGEYEVALGLSRIMEAFQAGRVLRV